MTENTLHPMFTDMSRLFEDDVTPDNVEQHIANYEAKLSEYFYPADIQALRPYRERFYEAVRGFASYDVGGRGNGGAV